MRTTITLEADVEALIRKTMREQGLSFKRAINQAVRAGLTQSASANAAPFTQRSVRLGRPRVDLTKALSLAGELDDQHTTRRYRSG